MGVLRTCRKCGLEAVNAQDLEDFVKDITSKHDRKNQCKRCHQGLAIKRRTERKKLAVEYKGGECVMCGIKHTDTNSPIFDFHHIDPTIKDDDPSQLMRGKWEITKVELDKCILLCANCHRLIHFTNVK